MAKLMVRVNEAARHVGMSTEAVRAIIRRNRGQIHVERIKKRHIEVSLPAILEHLKERQAQ